MCIREATKIQSTEAIAVAAGYAGARGSGVMQPSPNAATVLGTGINVQNILSQGMVPNFPEPE